MLCFDSVLFLGTARQSTGYSEPAATYNEPEPAYSEPEYQADSYDASFDVANMFGPETGVSSKYRNYFMQV